MKLTGVYFYGNRASDYAIENGYLDYGTLAKAVPHVLNNTIVEKFFFDPLDGIEDEEKYEEVFQWYITNESGAQVLRECGEVVCYNDELDMFVWGVTHFGTAWDYVLTDIELGEDNR